MTAFRRKLGSTFKRLVLLDEAIFEQLKRGVSLPSETNPQAYLKNMVNAHVEKAGLDDTDKLAVQRAASVLQPQSSSTLGHPSGPPPELGETLTVSRCDTSATDDDAESQYEEAMAPIALTATTPKHGTLGHAASKRSTPKAGLFKPATFVPHNVSSTSTVLPQAFIRTKPGALPIVELPAQYKNKYAELHQQMESTGKFAVDHQGQISINGDVIVGSNYGVLIKSLFVQSKAGDLENIGRRRLAHALVDSGIPSTAVSVATVRSYMDLYRDKLKPPQGGKGVPPPGKRAKMLYLYKI